jgi:hypothetical protein
MFEPLIRLSFQVFGNISCILCLGPQLPWKRNLLIGWALAILVITQATVLSVTSGNPLLPMLRGGVGLIVWLITSRFGRSLAG